MQHLLQKDTVSVTMPVVDGTEEYVLSGDFILPEYCPDVAVVLKCLVTPYIQSRHYSGDMLMLDGTAVVRVLYLDEERRCVRAAEFSQPLTASLRGTAGCEGVPVWVDVTQDYVNCRAVSPRRIEVRGGFTLRACGYGAQTLVLPMQAEDKHLYVRCKKQTVSAPLSVSEKMVLVNETLAFDSALPAAEQLLGGDCTAIVNECKLLSNKAIVKGQVYVHHLYTDDSIGGTTYVLQDAVPFSLIMDVDGAQEGSLHTVRVCVLSDTEECVAGADGPNTALEFSAKLLVQLCVYDKQEATFLLDVYHRDCPVTVSTQALRVQSLCEALRQTATVQKGVPLPMDNWRELLDVWVTPQQVGGQVIDGCVQLTASLLVSMLVRDTDGCVAYYERAEDVTMDCTQAPCLNAADVQADLAVTGLHYAVVGDKLDLRMTVSAAVMLWESVDENVLSEVALQRDAPYETDNTAVRLYYADAGECVWDIARHCHTSPQAICAENDLREETLSAKTVLLVPTE